MSDAAVEVKRSRALPFVQVSTEIVRDPDLSPNARALYVILATFVDMSTRQWQLYRSELARLMGRSVDTVDRASSELVESGILTIEQRRREGSNVLDASIYTLHDVERGVPDRGTRTGAGTSKDAGRGVAAPVRVGSRTHAEGVPAPVRQLTRVLQEPLQESLLNSSAVSTNEPAEDDKSKRGTRLPEDWIPPQAVRDEMRAECPDVDLRAEHLKFVDYWLSQPGRHGVKLSWTRTWRNWIRSANERLQPRVMASAGTSPWDRR